MLYFIGETIRSPCTQLAYAIFAILSYCCPSFIFFSRVSVSLLVHILYSHVPVRVHYNLCLLMYKLQHDGDGLKTV